jgi:hypothetical protein
VTRPENAELYKKFQQLASTMKNTYFVGRLALQILQHGSGGGAGIDDFQKDYSESGSRTYC